MTSWLYFFCWCHFWTSTAKKECVHCRNYGYIIVKKFAKYNFLPKMYQPTQIYLGILDTFLHMKRGLILKGVVYICRDVIDRNRRWRKWGAWFWNFNWKKILSSWFHITVSQCSDRFDWIEQNTRYEWCSDKRTSGVGNTIRWYTAEYWSKYLINIILMLRFP